VSTGSAAAVPAPVPEPPKPFGSYPPDDATFLVTDLAGVELETALEDRERAIQSGRHYSEMLPIEYRPSPEYEALFHRTLARTAPRLAHAVGVVGERILERHGPEVVLVSLARAGTPVGVLLRRWLASRHGLDRPHYSISIIRDRGIDTQALRYVVARHPAAAVQFVDGWTGKGVILGELVQACNDFAVSDGHAIDPTLAVLADPGDCTELFGTRDDFLVASACLNATVSGLVSRTVLNDAVIAPGQFHGAKWYRELEAEDVSNVFVDAVAAQFDAVAADVAATVAALDPAACAPTWAGAASIRRIQERYGIADANLVKPGVGETTRVLLRRLPWKVLVHPDRADELEHLLVLAAERGVPVEDDPTMTYSSCGIIRDLGDA
jgi:hypothetical protein